MKATHFLTALPAVLLIAGTASAQADAHAELDIHVTIYDYGATTSWSRTLEGDVLHARGEEGGKFTQVDQPLPFSGKFNAKVPVPGSGPVSAGWRIFRGGYSAWGANYYGIRNTTWAHAKIPMFNPVDPRSRAWSGAPIVETIEISGPDADDFSVSAGATATLTGGQAASGSGYQVFARASVTITHDDPGSVPLQPDSYTWQIQNGVPDVLDSVSFGQSGSPTMHFSKAPGQVIRVRVEYTLEALAYEGNPLGIELAGMSATRLPGAVAVQWDTSSEPIATGFRIHRARKQNGAYHPIGPVVSSLGAWQVGSSYSLFDSPVPRIRESPWYRLEEIDAQGSTFHPPVQVGNWP